MAPEYLAAERRWHRRAGRCLRRRQWISAEDPEPPCCGGQEEEPEQAAEEDTAVERGRCDWRMGRSS